MSCRALNAYHADIYGEYSDRMTPAAMIRCTRPEEAIDELEYSIKTLNLKVPVIASLVRRTIPKLEEQAPDLAWHVHRLDTLGLTAITITTRSGQSAWNWARPRPATPAHSSGRRRALYPATCITT